MKKYLNYTLLVLFIASLSFSSCKKDPIETDDGKAYETLTTYMKANDLTFGKIRTNADGVKFAMGAPANGDVSGKWVMDIRSATDYATGHIENAHNIEFKDILTAAATADKPILVVCYTGQSACYATALLRLYGHKNAQALKWGMSGWHADFDKWTPNCNDLATATNWTSDITEAGNFMTPGISTTATDGEVIVKERVEAVVAAGFKGVSGTDVLANPSNYYINNWFPAEHYTGFGHVKGAVRVNPLTIDVCNRLDASAKVVTYCYTGQSSAVISAILNVMGYDAYSLTFGMNGMYTSNPFWTAGAGVINHWGHDAKPKSLPTVK